MAVKILGGGGGAGGTRGGFLFPIANPGYLAAIGSDIWLPAQGSAITQGAGVALGINFLRAVPFIAIRGGVLDLLMAEVTVIGGAGSVIRLGAYRADPVSFYPTSLIAQSGDIATDGAIGVKQFATSVLYTAGSILWFAYNAGVAAPTIRQYNNGQQSFLGLKGGATLTVQPFCLLIAQAYGAFPANFPAGAATDISQNSPVLACRFSTAA